MNNQGWSCSLHYTFLHTGDEIFTDSGSPKERWHLQQTPGPFLTKTWCLLLHLRGKKKNSKTTQMCLDKQVKELRSPPKQCTHFAEATHPTRVTINPTSAVIMRKKNTHTNTFSSYVTVDVFLLPLIYAHGLRDTQTEIGPKKRTRPSLRDPVWSCHISNTHQASLEPPKSPKTEPRQHWFNTVLMKP